MKQKLRQTGGNQTLKRLMAEKKKVAIAVLLIAVMAVMWIRLLAKKGPSDGVAAITVQAAAAEQPQPKMKITYVALPYVKGRNDVLARDIFAGNKWEGFGAKANGTRRQNEIVKKNDKESLTDKIETVGKELKLEAIFSGKNPQASVCGTLISPQGKLTVKYEGDQYEFKVIAINDSEVVLECKGVQVKLNGTAD